MLNLRTILEGRVLIILFKIDLVPLSPFTHSMFYETQVQFGAMAGTVPKSTIQRPCQLLESGGRGKG